MTIENLKSGIEILIAHGAKGYCIDAEHDVFYAADARDTKMPLSAIRQLHKLGWFIDKEVERWSAYT